MGGQSVRESFPAWLREQMDARGLTLSELVRRTGFSETAIRHWLRRDPHQTIPHVGHCGALARALGIGENQVRLAAGRELLAEAADIDLNAHQHEAAKLVGQMPAELQPKAVALLRVLAE